MFIKIKTRDGRFSHGARVKSPSGRLGTFIEDYIPDSCLYDKYHRVQIKWDDGEIEIRYPQTLEVVK